MIDAYLSVLADVENKASAEDALTELFKGLPLDEIPKVAAIVGEVQKEACLSPDSGSGSWLKQYEGTPHYEQALALEQEALNLEAERIQRRIQTAQLENDRDMWTQEDMVRLKKRMLDLELTKHHAGMSAAAEPDVYPPSEEAPKTAAVTADQIKNVAGRGAQLLSGSRAKMLESRVGTVSEPLKKVYQSNLGKEQEAVRKARMLAGGAGVLGAGVALDKNAEAQVEYIDLAGRALAHAMHKEAETTGSVAEELATDEAVGRTLGGAGGGVLGAGILGGVGGAAGADFAGNMALRKTRNPLIVLPAALAGGLAGVSGGMLTGGTLGSGIGGALGGSLGRTMGAPRALEAAGQDKSASALVDRMVKRASEERSKEALAPLAAVGGLLARGAVGSAIRGLGSRIGGTTLGGIGSKVVGAVKRNPFNTAMTAATVAPMLMGGGKQTAPQAAHYGQQAMGAVM